MRTSNVLFKDLTGNLTDGQHEGLGIGVFLLAGLAAVIVTMAMPLLPAAGLPIALIGGAVAFRIAGPKDARSFRLYKGLRPSR